MRQKFILLVEDDPNLRHSIALVLQRAKYLVTVTDCVYEAIELLQTGKYHLVISDDNIQETREVLLPKVTGRSPTLTLLILSDQHTLESSAATGITGAHYLPKPIAPERLLDFVGEFLG